MAYVLDADTLAEIKRLGWAPVSNWVEEHDQAGRVTAGHVLCLEGVLFYSYAENSWHPAPFA